MSSLCRLMDFDITIDIGLIVLLNTILKILHNKINEC